MLPGALRHTAFRDGKNKPWQPRRIQAHYAECKSTMEDIAVMQEQIREALPQRSGSSVNLGAIRAGPERRRERIHEGSAGPSHFIRKHRIGIDSSEDEREVRTSFDVSTGSQNSDIETCSRIRRWDCTQTHKIFSPFRPRLHPEAPPNIAIWT